MGFAKGKSPKNSTRLKTEEVEVDAILLNPVVVDKQNYRSTVVQDGHVSLSEVQGSIK
jgi:ABC-type xylose transport system substrate-binding protein